MEVLHALQHPNVLRIYEVYEDLKYIHVVSEYCEGGSLLDRVCRKSYLSEKQSAKYARQLFSAIHYMHNRGYIHRDLKPDNILFSDKHQKVIKIIDFGLSTKYKQDKPLVTRWGTPHYVAPEVLN